MKFTRTQLTLFVDEKDSEIIEGIRKEFNPVQFELIKCHVTLCREEELVAIEKVIENLENLHYPSFTIDFGRVQRFSIGKGILIPAIGDNAEFHNLRSLILKGVINNPGKPAPHITLMHPRNSTCTDSDFQKIEKMKLPTKLEFTKISLIQQEENSKWDILSSYLLIHQYKHHG